MSEKYLIFGATGSVGSSLAEQLKNSKRLSIQKKLKRFLVLKSKTSFLKKRFLNF